MAVRIRLKRTGRRNRPYYRICVFHQRTRRDGTPIEELGSYDPEGASFAQKVRLKRERALHWLNVGAQPSETVASLLRRAGVRRGEPLAPKAEAVGEEAPPAGGDPAVAGEAAEAARDTTAAPALPPAEAPPS